MKINKNITLDLNGHTIFNDDNTIFKVEDDKTFTLKDTKGGGKIIASGGYHHCIDVHGKLVMYGGFLQTGGVDSDAVRIYPPW